MIIRKEIQLLLMIVVKSLANYLDVWFKGVLKKSMIIFIYPEMERKAHSLLTKNFLPVRLDMKNSVIRDGSKDGF